MRYIYFLTLDKVEDLKNKVTPREIITTRNEILLKIKGFPISPYKVDCFELKQDKKNGCRLHYHMQLYSHNSFISYKMVKKKGWSNNIKKLKTNYDVSNNAGYIQKHKIDKCVLFQYINKFKLTKQINVFDKIMK